MFDSLKKIGVIYLFLEREEGRERNIDWWPLIHTLTGTEPAAQACVPWLGIREAGTFSFAG